MRRWAEVVSALLRPGGRLFLREHDSVPGEALPGMMARGEMGEWRLTDWPWRLACSYTLQAGRAG